MNPFSRFLSSKSDDPSFAEFVEYWDALEALVIRVYKRQGATPADLAKHREIRAWLSAHYPIWREGLRPYWREALVAGRPAAHDPFGFLLAVERADGFVDNWPAMQTLPAAREAINRRLTESGGQ